MKQNEDAKAMLDQSHLGQVAEKKEIHNAQEVVNAENTEFYNKNSDAREKGSNEYYGDGGKQRRKQPKDRVIVKNQGGGFDFRI